MNFWLDELTFFVSAGGSASFLGAWMICLLLAAVGFFGGGTGGGSDGVLALLECVVTVTGTVNDEFTSLDVFEGEERQLQAQVDNLLVVVVLLIVVFKTEHFAARGRF